MLNVNGLIRFLDVWISTNFWNLKRAVSHLLPGLQKQLLWDNFSPILSEPVSEFGCEKGKLKITNNYRLKVAVTMATNGAG